MPRIIAVVLLLAVMVYALIDCARTPREEVPPGLAKPVWIVLILVVPVLGAVTWIVVSRLARSGGAGGGGGGGVRRPGPGGPPRRPGPVAPDDDPEFLARIEAARRRAERERRAARERGESEATERGETEATETPDGSGEGEKS